MRNYFSIKHYTLLKRKTATTYHRAIFSFKLQRPTKRICEIAEGHAFSSMLSLSFLFWKKGKLFHFSLKTFQIKHIQCCKFAILEIRNIPEKWISVSSHPGTFTKNLRSSGKGVSATILCSSQKLQECRASSSLTYFWLMLPFYTPWKKSQKTFGFLML